MLSENHTFCQKTSVYAHSSCRRIYTRDAKRKSAQLINAQKSNINERKLRSNTDRFVLLTQARKPSSSDSILHICKTCKDAWDVEVSSRLHGIKAMQDFAKIIDI